MDVSDISGESIAAFIGNKVSVVGKIASIKEVEDIKSTKRVFKKQEFVLIDKSKACRLLVWEDLVKSMESGKCYNIEGLSVKAYNGQKYLSTQCRVQINQQLLK